MTYSRLALIERDLLIMRVKAKSRVKASGSNERSKACHTHDGPHTLRQGARTPDELEKHDLLDQHDRDTTDTIQYTPLQPQTTALQESDIANRQW